MRKTFIIELQLNITLSQILCFIIYLIIKTAKYHFKNISTIF